MVTPMLMSFFVGAALYAVVSFVVFAVMSIMNLAEAEQLSIMFLEWLFVSFCIFALIMTYILWSIPDA